MVDPAARRDSLYLAALHNGVWLKMDTQLKVDRKQLIDNLGGEAAVRTMNHEARADALEDHLSAKLDAVVTAKAGKSYPAVADHENAVDGRGYRRGIGRLFFHEHNNR